MGEAVKGGLEARCPPHTSSECSPQNIMSKIVPVILAGGAGTRLWPVSRDALPKQFLPLVGERSTYQDTLLRVAEGELFARPIVITGSDFRFFARRQAEDLGINATVLI